MILFVCTGNICRSAMAEVLFRHHGGLAEIQVEAISGGLLAWDGAPLMDYALEVLTSAGVGDTLHASKALSREQVSSADLIVAMTRDHAQGVLSRDSTAKNRTFLAGELLRLVKAHPYSANSHLENTGIKPKAQTWEGAEENWVAWIAGLHQIRAENPPAVVGANQAKMGSIIGLAKDEVPDPATGGLEEHQKIFKILNELTSLLAENIASADK